MVFCIFNSNVFDENWCFLVLVFLLCLGEGLVFKRFMSLLDYYFEELVVLCGVFVVVGVDEVGCGFLVGLVMVVVVILYFDCIFEGLNDLKKLSKKCCEVFYE